MSLPQGKLLGQRWWVKVALVAAFMIPPAVATDFDPANTPQVVRAVLEHPVIVDSLALLVLTKYALLVLVVGCLLRPSLVGTLGWGYYAVVLVVISVGQNIAITDQYGIAWLVGNTVLQLVVAGFAATDVVRGLSRTRRSQLRPRRLWVLAPMALAWLFPYVVTNGNIVARLPAGALINEAGVTYCMVTPVVLGLMILFADGVHHSTLSVAAWTGLIFGVVNAAIWFGADQQSWWMGVLHLPLLVLSGYALWLARAQDPQPVPAQRLHGAHA